MHQLHGSSVTYRIAVGPRQGRKVFTLQTLPASDPDEWVGNVDGFSLHAGVAVKAHERIKLERICRYITRSPVSGHRVVLPRQRHQQQTSRLGYAGVRNTMGPVSVVSQCVPL